MSLSAPHTSPNGVRTYAGHYRDGQAVYFYNEDNGTRIYTGRFWFSRRYYSFPLGRSTDVACGCFSDGIKSGRWTFAHKMHGLRQRLSVSYSDGSHDGTYSYKSVYKSRALGFKSGVTTLVSVLYGDKAVGDVSCCLNGETVTGSCDGDGRPDGLWKMDSTKTAKCETRYEMWEHGVCLEAYVIDEATGERKTAKGHLPDLVSSLVRRECMPLENIVRKGSEAWRGFRVR